MKNGNFKLKNTLRVKEYNAIFKKSQENRHVIKHPKGWAVRKPGASKASRVLSTQKEAENVADKMARRNKGVVIVHGRDGSIRRVT